MDFLIQNAALVPPQAGLDTANLLVISGRIAAIGPPGYLQAPDDTRVVDAGGLILSPGFLDLQINGGFGRDFTQDPAAIWDVAARLPRYGVTAFLATIITSPLSTIEHAIEILRQGPPAGFKGAQSLGLHLEGPFLNPERCGAHNPRHLLAPASKLVENWNPENGVRMVTLAPELPGALDLVRTLAERGVVVSAGHSQASLEQAREAFSAGLTCGTHIFNAMPPVDHRHPGLVEALLLEPSIRFGIIVDGIHLHPEIIRLAWKTAGPGRVFLVSDGMAALGMPPGEYRLGEYLVQVDEAAPRLAGGRLAGSILQPDQAVRNLLRYTGCTLEEALGAITTTPAGLFGQPAAPALLSPGMPATFTLLTRELQVAATVVSGEFCYTSGSFSAERFPNGNA